MNINALLNYYLSMPIDVKNDNGDKKQGENVVTEDKNAMIIYNHIKVKELFLVMLNKLIVDSKLKV